jgi:hypothetical protein
MVSFLNTHERLLGINGYSLICNEDARIPLNHHCITTSHMRTTLSIDEDLLVAAKALAAQRKVSVGKIVSELMRKGLNAEARIETGPGGFPVFPVPPHARPITLEAVKEAEDEL